MILFAMAALYYHLPILVILISLVYSGTRYDDWDAIVHEAVHWGLRMVLFLATIAVVLIVLGRLI